MTHGELLAHVEQRLATPNGTIARRTVEQFNGKRGETVSDVRPMALAFVRAAHGKTCECVHCECGR